MARKSYFTKYANAYLNYPVPTGEYITNPETGNVEDEMVMATATAILETKGNMRTNNPGVDDSTVNVEGYMVNPMTLDSLAPVSIPCVIDGRQGLLELVLTLVSPWGEDKYLGQFIKGSFTMTGRGDV